MKSEQFDSTIEQWLTYQSSVRGRLRLALLERGLLPHVPKSPCDVLDVGGGLGELAGVLAGLGHRVTLADYSRDMLNRARTRLDPGLIRLQYLDLAEPNNLPAASLDVIICHNVLEYVPDIWAALQHLHAALRPGGLLSVAFGNARHMPLQAAILHGDLSRAHRELVTGDAESRNIFGTQTRVLVPDTVLSLLHSCGFNALQTNGIRCVSDLMSRSQTDIDANFAALLELESDLMIVPAYSFIGRFVQIIAQRHM